MANGKVTSLNAFVPAEVRKLAKLAYAAREKSDAAFDAKVRAMREFSKACKQHNVNPSTIQVGSLLGTSLVPAVDWSANVKR